MAFENYEDMRAGDVIECFRVEVALEMISSVLETATHVFVQSHGAVIIIPAAAFASAAEKQAFAVNLEAMAQEVPSWASTDWASPNTPD
jgi:hypothetical protein